MIWLKCFDYQGEAAVLVQDVGLPRTSISLSASFYGPGPFVLIIIMIIHDLNEKNVLAFNFLNKLK